MCRDESRRPIGAWEIADEIILPSMCVTTYFRKITLVEHSFGFEENKKGMATHFAFVFHTILDLNQVVGLAVSTNANGIFLELSKIRPFTLQHI